jgi:hypothetical protein
MTRPGLFAAVFLMFLAGASEAASTWYVKADAAAGGDGSRSRPFATLEQVETASRPGDTIRVLPSMRALDGGIQLKDGQRLTGSATLSRKPPPAARSRPSPTRARRGTTAMPSGSPTTISSRTFMSTARRVPASSG